MALFFHIHKLHAIPVGLALLAQEMTLLLTNGILTVILAYLPLEACKIEAERINKDFHYIELIAFCEKTNHIEYNQSLGVDAPKPHIK